MKTMNKITRRSFLKAALGAAAVSTFSLTGCGGSASSAASGTASSAAASSAAALAEAGQTFKVGIVNYVDHASLNQIVASVESRLDEMGKEKGITFSTPIEICKKMKSVGELNVPDTLSWVDEERDVSTWLGNSMQREAFNKLYSVADRVRIANDPRINQDWDYLQASNNFRFMTTKPSNVGLDRGIYSDPFDAFTNYMNILGDFLNRVNDLYPSDVDNDQLEGLLTTIKNQDEEIEVKDKEIVRLQAKLEKIEKEAEKLRAEKKPAAKKTATAAKAPAKKTATKASAAAKKAPAKKAATKEETTEKK